MCFTGLIIFLFNVRATEGTAVCFSGLIIFLFNVGVGQSGHLKYSCMFSGLTIFFYVRATEGTAVCFSGSDHYISF